VRVTVVLALLSTAASASGGKLIDVRAIPGADSTIVQLEADAPPSFTTMKLTSPPRVVVDLAETSVSAVARQQEVGDGTVRRIAVADAGAHTARVVIELVADAEFDVRASQSLVEVRIPRRVAIAQADPAPSPVASTPAAPAETAETDGTGSRSAPAADDDPIPEVRERAALPTVADDDAIPEVRERAALPTVALVGGAPPEEPRAPAPARPSMPARGTGASRAGRSAAITGIGFRPMSGGEVIVRSDRELEYEVSSAETSVLIHLRNARIPLQNNRRPLDTRFFDGPVERVVPLQVPGGTDVRIELRQRAEMHLSQSGAVLTVSFTPRG
jgi:hypothetical protein